MKKNGFVTSALLYGILSLFLLLVLGTVAIIGNRKLTNDKIKQSALDDVQVLTTDESCFTIENSTITKYDCTCTKTVFIPNSAEITKIGENAFTCEDDIKLTNITISSNIEEIASNAFEDNENVLFILKNPNSEILTDVEESTGGRYWGATNSTYRID